MVEVEPPAELELQYMVEETRVLADAWQQLRWAGVLLVEAGRPA